MSVSGHVLLTAGPGLAWPPCHAGLVLATPLVPNYLQGHLDTGPGQMGNAGPVSEHAFQVRLPSMVHMCRAAGPLQAVLWTEE